MLSLFQKLHYKSSIIGETFAQNIHTKKIKCKFGVLLGQSSSTLKDDDVFEILEPSNCRKKDGTKFDPKFRGEHNASIHVPNSLPPSRLLTSTRPKASLNIVMTFFILHIKIL